MSLQDAPLPVEIPKGQLCKHKTNGMIFFANEHLMANNQYEFYGPPLGAPPEAATYGDAADTPKTDDSTPADAGDVPPPPTEAEQSPVDESTGIIPQSPDGDDEFPPLPEEDAAPAIPARKKR